MTLGNEWAGAELDPVVRVAMSDGLSAGAASVLEVLKWLPLASAGNLAAILSRPVTGILADLRKAKGLGLVESAQLGCTVKQRRRWFLTDLCLGRSGLRGLTWHDAAAKCRLLQLTPAVEQLYPVVASVEGLGAFREFQWLDSTGDEGPSCDAAALYEAGWVALFRCGSLLSEYHLTARLRRFPLDCQVLAVGSPRPWPSQIHMVTADEWEAELAVRALEDCGMARMSGVWCVSDGNFMAPALVSGGSGWVYQPVKRRHSEGVSWETSLAQSPWAGAGGLMAGRVLGVVVQWPGSHLSFIRALLGEGKGEGRVGEMCKQLVADGFVMRSGERQGARYFATGSGLNLLSLQDRIHHLDARSRTHLSQWPEANRTPPRHSVSPNHEDGLRGVLGVFAAAGCPVANGTRYTEHLGNDGGIAGDGLVYLALSPFGEGWHHVEYERSARRMSRISNKLRGYGSSRRRDGYPVILVCWDEKAEEQFQAEAHMLGLPLVTTILGRLKEHGPLHPSKCWSLYGQPARLG